MARRCLPYEVDPADGYSIIKSSETVYITDDGTQNVITVSFDNAPDGILLIRKVCSVNPSVTLQDAEFKIMYADGTLIGDSNGVFRTDEKGEIRIPGLKPGKSVIVTETRAPAGFLIDTQSQTIQIKEGRTVSLTFKNQPKGSIIVQKRDSDTGEPLPGAEFRVTTAAGCEVGLDGVIGDSTLTQNGLFTTDSNGEIRISNLAPGAYVLTETKAPAGYVMDAPSTNVVIGANGDTQTVIVTNTRKGGLIIEKYDSVTKQPLRGAQFKITTASGELVPDNEGMTSSNGLYTTDINGQIVLSKLLPGTYVVAEEKAPDNYRKDPTPQTVVVNAGDTQTIRFYDDPLCTLTILKRDAVTKKPLAKAEFLVRDSEGKAIGPDNGIYITGTDGTVTVSGLQPDATIVVSEQKAPTGYLKDETPKNIVVRTGVANSLIFDDEPATTLIIQKFIEGTENEPLSGVAFKVTDGSGAAVGPDDGTYYTDKAGEIVLNGLEPGTTVKAREIKTVKGFVLDGTPQDILIKAGEVQRLTFWNKRDCSLTILKQDTDKNPLSGAVFLVTDEDGGAIGTNNGRYTSDRNGLIVIPGLQPGQILIVTEEQAPDTYIKDSTPKVIKIKQGSNSLIFENAKIGTLVIRKLDKVSKTPLANVEFELTYAEGGFVDDDYGHLSSKGRYTTNDMGEIRVPVVGTVVVKEVTPCPGYVIDQATQIQTVTVNPADTQTITVYNEPLCSLTLTKLDSVTGKPVPNTTFAVKDGNGNLLGNYTTGKDGTVTVTGLVPGSTVVVNETKVPTGYVLDSTPKSIIVKNGTGNSIVSGSISSSSGSGGSGSVGGGGNNLDFENDPTTTLIIRKFISGTANEPLSGVAFKVVDSSGAAVGPDDGTYYTNNVGEIVLKNLEPGTTITAREIKTVDGFVLDGTPQDIQIKTGEKQQLTFWNKRAGTLVIQKKDKLTGKPLAGVEFQVTDANGSFVPDENGHISSNGIYRTNDKGEIRINGVVGTLVVTETKTISGYSIDEAARTQTVTVNPEDVQTVVFYNTPNSTLVIEKYVEGTNEPMKGVTFLVTDSSGSFVGKSGGEYITDENGRIEITGLTPGETITAKEIKTLEGYILDPAPKSINITEGGANTLRFYNQRQGTLVIRKLDKLTKEPLAGVEFELTYAEGGYVDDTNGHLSSKGLYTTDQNGEIRISGISGTIVVKETKTIPGYTIDPASQSQTVTINSADTQTLTFYNTPGTTLTIQKYAEGSNEPLKGVTFLITDSSGAPIGPNQGEYVTDKNGQIVLNSLTPGTTIIAKETKALDGYILDGQPQSILIKEGEAQQMTFYNKANGGVEIIKVDAADKTKRLANVTFEIRRMDDGLVDTVTTGADGRVELDLDAGDYYALEIEAAEGYKLDDTPVYFTVEDGKPTTVTITNKAFSGILLHKTDSTTGKGIYGVTFLLYDSSNKPIGQYTTDNSGYIYIEDLTVSGKYFLKEMENKGYIVDTQMKTVYVTAGETTLVEWENTPITGQIQITKTSAEYNTMNGWPAGTPLPDTEFEIYDYRTNNLVDTVKTDKNGLASSRPLPLGRYKVVESKSANFYGLDKTPMEAEIEYAGQIVRMAMTNKSLYTNVSITKRGYSEVVPGQSIKYDFSGIGNNSTTALTSFYWRDTLPTKAVRLDRIVTGTYNVPGNYKIVYKTNLSKEYRTLADNVSTQQNRVIIASPAALGLASNECVTEFMCVFGVVPANFRQVEAPAVYCNVLSGLTGGTQFVNQADVGGVYNGQWIMATDRWVTTVYKPSKPLPRTGY